MSNRLGDRLVVLVEAFLCGLVVVGRDGENAVGAQFLAGAREFDHFVRVVSARAGEHRDPSSPLLRP